MGTNKTINIASQFGKLLGGRFKNLGPYSGEEFYETLLKKNFLEAQCDNSKLVIELDGTKGYPSSFLDQSFGELARTYGVEKVCGTIEFKTKLFQWVVDYIKKDIWGKIG